VPSRFLLRGQESDHPLGPRKHIQDFTSHAYYQRIEQLDNVKILTTTQLDMLYNLCVILRHKTQACVVVLRVLNNQFKCFLTHNPNNSKQFDFGVFFLENRLGANQHFRLHFYNYVNACLHISKLRISCRLYKVVLLLDFLHCLIVRCVDGRLAK